MQPLVIGIATTATVLILLRQQAVSIAVVLLDHKVKLRCQVLVDDDFDVSGLIQEHPAPTRSANQLALTVHQQGQHATTP
ncbi:hypothetical protein D3C80_1702210 [compost metagenome]